MISGIRSTSIFLQSISCGLRLIILLSGLVAMLWVLFGMELFAQPNLTNAFPKWGAIVTGVLMVFAMQGLLSVILFTLTVLGRRSQARIVPLRDAEGFVGSVMRLFPAG
jgi:uncharacterized protein involved in cysteine biosynthesis